MAVTITDRYRTGVNLDPPIINQGSVSLPILFLINHLQIQEVRGLSVQQ